MKPYGKLPSLCLLSDSVEQAKYTMIREGEDSPLPYVGESERRWEFPKSALYLVWGIVSVLE